VDSQQESEGGLPPELAEHWRKIASPANVAFTASRGEWLPAWHLKHISRALVEAVTDPEQSFLNLQVTVRGGKSQIATVWNTVWTLGLFPKQHILIVCATAALAEKFSQQARDIFKEWGPVLFGKKVREDMAAKDEWGTSDGGMVRAVGVGGLVTGYGFNVICVGEGTLVDTPSGQQPIETVASHGGTVWAYDHESGSVVERHVVAATESESDDLVEVEFASGRTLRCTPDHRIWINGVGYVEAGLVKEGAEVLRVGGGELSGLRHSVPGAGLRVGEEGAYDRDAAPVLHPRVLDAVAVLGDGTEASLHPVWAADGEGEPAVLRGGLPVASAPAASPGPPLPGVRGLFHPEAAEAAALFAGVRERDTLSEDDRGWEPAVCGRDELRALVPLDEALDPRARRRLRRLWSHERQARRSPHRRWHDGQSPGEPCHALSGTSPLAPQVEVDTVSVVRRVRGEGHLVYDLTVEGAHNFFAGEVLVHNCIDDPIADSKQARSETVKKSIVEWYSGTLRTRLEPGGTMVLVMARWTDDDLSGVVVEKALADGTGDPWRVIKIGALAVCPPDEDPETWTDEWGRRDGESFWPERWPSEVLCRIRDSLPDPTAWDALYMQDPTPKSGNDFERANWCYVAPGELQIIEKIRAWDLASSANRGDWTVGALMGRTSDRRTVVLDIIRGRWTPDVVEQRVLEAAERDGTEVKIRMETPKGDSGVTALHYSNLLPHRDFEGWPVKGQKQERAAIMAGAHRRGRLLLPTDVEWAETLISEWERFPNGRHDDQVDACSLGFNQLWRTSGEVNIELPGASVGLNGPIPQADAEVVWRGSMPPPADLVTAE